MKRAISISLFVLLIYHTLAYGFVVVGSWWRAENDLSEKLLVYRSVDSVVEFEVPLQDSLEIINVSQVTADGFTYKGHYYSVISMEVQGNLLHIAGIELPSHSVWQNDLLAFLEKHLSHKSGQKANQFLKFLLKEYSPGPRAIFRFLLPFWLKKVQIPALAISFSARGLLIYSPPPER